MVELWLPRPSPPTATYSHSHSAMTPDQLLSDLRGLTHNARMRRMVEVGRAALTDASAARTLEELGGRGFYERRLALTACMGSRDAAGVLRALRDPSRGIRGLAYQLASVLCADDDLAELIANAGVEVQDRLIRRLNKRRRIGPIDLLLGRLAEAGEQERLIEILPFGSAETVQRHLAAFTDLAHETDWRRLAWRHPRIVSKCMLDRAESAERRDNRLLGQANAALPALAYAAPDDAVSLIRALSRHVPLGSLDLRPLLKRRPAEVAELVAGLGDRSRVNLGEVAHRLEPAQLIELARHASELLPYRTDWFTRLSPEVRAAVFQACERGWQDREGLLPEDLVGLLPRELREREGRRHLGLPVLSTRPLERLPYVSFLPWDEALAAVQGSLSSPDAELRAASIAALLGAVRYNRDRAGEALALARGRKHEQDPVRMAMLGALRDLPPGVWREEHLPELAAVIREALNAADLSYPTAAAAEGLVLALLPFHPAWTAEWLATLVKERGSVSFYGLENRLTDSGLERIAPALLPVFRSWETREREAHLLAAAGGLGRRLKAFPGLIDILERRLEATKQSWVASQALLLILEQARARGRALIPALLEKDRSWVTLAPVHQYLHRRRQDLLTPYLGQASYSGRFSTGRTRFVLPIFSGFHRWTPEQQEIFARTVYRVAGDSVRDTPTGIQTVRQLGAMPDIPPTRLVYLASDKREAVRDAALRALGALDAGQGVPTLLEALADERARIAIYALRTSLLDMPPDAALALLRGVSTERVTVAKEVVRLLGELRCPEAYQDLLAMDPQELHRDVRVALVRALWGHLGREETWPILDRAADSPDPAIATIAGRAPAGRISAQSQDRLAALVARLMRHADPKVRVDALYRSVELPLPDRQKTLLRPILDAAGSAIPDERTAAVQALFATYAAAEGDAIREAMERLRPNRRGIRLVRDSLLVSLDISRRQYLAAARALLDAMAPDPLTAEIRAEVALAALPWEEVTPLLERMAETGELHADVLVAARSALQRAGRRSDAEELDAVEASFSASPDERLRRLALAALVTRARGAEGWTEERLARLQAFQEDPSPLVAAAAQFTFPPPDDPGSDDEIDEYDDSDENWEEELANLE